MPKKVLEQTFGERLQDARMALPNPKRKGFPVSPETLGAEMGVSGQAWRNWENGTNEPDLATIKKIARLVGKRAGFLAFGEVLEKEDLSKYAPADELPAGAFETIEDRDKREAARKQAAKKKRA